MKVEDDCLHTMTLHDMQELDDDLGRRPNEDLALATTLRVDDVVLWNQLDLAPIGYLYKIDLQGNRSAI